MTDYKLYGNEMSYYTGKVRAYLDWKGLAYAEVLPTLDVFKTILLPQVGRTTTNGLIWNLVRPHYPKQQRPSSTPLERRTRASSKIGNQKLASATLRFQQ